MGRRREVTWHVGNFLGLLAKVQAHPMCSMEATGLQALRASHGASGPAVQKSLSEVRVPRRLQGKLLGVNAGHVHESEAKTVSHGSFSGYCKKSSQAAVIRCCYNLM